MGRGGGGGGVGCGVKEDPELIDLPYAALVKIISFLAFPEVMAMASTCTVLRLASLDTSIDQTLWKTVVGKTSSAASRLITVLKELTWRQLYFQQKHFNGSCLKDVEVVESLILPTPEFEHDKADYLLKLMARLVPYYSYFNFRVKEYFKYTNNVQKYTEKLDNLYKMYATLKAHIEAGLCLLEKSKLYTWEDRLETPGGGPEQNIKEQILRSAMTHFGEGKYWEWALEHMEVLRVQLSKGLPSSKASEGKEGDPPTRASSVVSPKSPLPSLLVKVSNIHFSGNAATLKLEAKLAGLMTLKETYSKYLQTHDRLFEQYFFVDFTGKCDFFGKNVENKKFIARGDEGERILTFVKKLQLRFDKAKIIYTHTAEREGECIYVHACDPVILTPALANTLDLPYHPPHIPEDAPPKSRAFYNQLNLKVFVYTKPFMKDVVPGTPLSEEEKFSKLWISQTYLVTGQSFPGLTRRQEIIKEKEILKCPLENACDTLKAKTRDIQRKAENANLKPTPQSINSLSMSISGVVDAAVSGGVKHYMSAFLSREFIENNPSQQLLVVKLMKHLHSQKHAIFDAIQVHRKLIPPEMAVLHAKHERCFEQWKQSLEEKCDNAEHIIHSTRASNTSSPADCQSAFSGSPPDILSEITNSIFGREDSVDYRENRHRRQSVSSEIGMPTYSPLDHKTHSVSDISSVPGSEASEDSCASVRSGGSSSIDADRLVRPRSVHGWLEGPQYATISSTRPHSHHHGHHTRRNATSSSIPIVPLVQSCSKDGTASFNSQLASQPNASPTLPEDKPIPIPPDSPRKTSSPLPTSAFNDEALQFNKEQLDRINELKKEKEDIYAQKVALSTHNEELVRHNEGLFKQNKELAQQLEEISKQKEDISRQNEEHTKSMEEFATQKEKLLEENKKLALQVEDFSRRKQEPLEEITRQKDVLFQQMSRLNTQLDEVQELLSVQNVDLEEWKEKASKYKARAKSNSKKAQASEELAQQLQKENTSLKSKLEEASRLKTEKEGAQQSLAQLQEEFQRCKDQLQEEQKKTSKLKGELKQAKKQTQLASGLMETAEHLEKEKAMARELQMFKMALGNVQPAADPSSVTAADLAAAFQMALSRIPNLPIQRLPADTTALTQKPSPNRRHERTKSLTLRESASLRDNLFREFSGNLRESVSTPRASQLNMNACPGTPPNRPPSEARPGGALTTSSSSPLPTFTIPQAKLPQPDSPRKRGGSPAPPGTPRQQQQQQQQTPSTPLTSKMSIESTVQISQSPSPAKPPGTTTTTPTPTSTDSYTTTSTFTTPSTPRNSKPTLRHRSPSVGGLTTQQPTSTQTTPAQTTTTGNAQTPTPNQPQTPQSTPNPPQEQPVQQPQSQFRIPTLATPTSPATNTVENRPTHRHSHSSKGMHHSLRHERHSSSQLPTDLIAQSQSPSPSPSPTPSTPTSSKHNKH
ncbi:DOCK family protein [Pelomyxa schiedti]|nr:DOCK family protein [Pelomyxa schiedti]